MKILTGRIKSKIGEKTARVSVIRMVVHPKYKKRFKRQKEYLVHDEVGLAVGDKVEFTDSKPYSKMKKWKVIERNRK